MRAQDVRNVAQPLQPGAIVRPAHKGEDEAGRLLDWTRLRAKVTAVYPDIDGRPRLDVRWLGAAVAIWGETGTRFEPEDFELCK